MKNNPVVPVISEKLLKFYFDSGKFVDILNRDLIVIYKQFILL